MVGSRESEGKSKSPQALFLLPAFSFGEAKENADGQLQISNMSSYMNKSVGLAVLYRLLRLPEDAEGAGKRDVLPEPFAADPCEAADRGRDADVIAAVRS